MKDMKLEDLLMEAAESDAAEITRQIIERIKAVEDITSGDMPANIEFMLESWDDEDISEHRAELCLLLAERGIPDSAIVRKAIGDGIKKLLPPFLTSTGFLRAIGVHGSTVKLVDVARRYHTLLDLKTGLLIYLPTSTVWGKINSIDGFSSSVSVAGINNTTAYAIPLDTVLDVAFLFDCNHKVMELAEFSKTRKISSAKYRESAQKHAIGGITESEIEAIAKSSLTNIFNPDEFNKWWDISTQSATAANQRGVGDARSIHELHVLAKALVDSEVKSLPEEQVEKLNLLFGKIRLPAALKEEAMLCEALSMMASAMDDSQLAEATVPLINRVRFLPEFNEEIRLVNFEVWGKVPVKYLNELGRMVSLIFDKEYMAAYVSHLPLRCLNVFCKFTDDEFLKDEILARHSFTSDILLWIWRNRKKVCKTLLPTLNINDVIKALSQSSLPKAWDNAQRDLKKLLVDNAEFQKILLDNAKNNIGGFVVALQNGTFFESGEQQSLLVKLSRTSPELRDALENGGAAKIFAASKQTQPSAPVEHQPTLTSFNSHRRLLKELDNIKNVQIPENRESLKTARAHGDFKENSEYDAAKERRNFLSKRRDELESAILNIQPTDFKMVDVNDTVVVGCLVELKEKSKTKVVTYYLLGAHDGDPDKHRISYQTPFGQCLLDNRSGTEVTMPDGNRYEIVKVAPLPEKIRETME
ncbi:MAG: GreA/GreB family elongation factor [Victivallaceae bacterium]|nr:GreA/GreB family elongation factor [Victivallaceae bacterium]